LERIWKLFCYRNKLPQKQMYRTILWKRIVLQRRFIDVEQEARERGRHGMKGTKMLIYKYT